MIKRFHSLGYLSCYVLPATVIVGFYLGGIFNYLTLVVVFAVIPLFDQWNGLDSRIVSPEKEKSLAGASIHRYILFSWVLFQLLFLGWAFYVFTTMTNPFHSIGFILGVGLVTGAIGITVAHELGHKKSKLDQFLAKTLLLTVYYMHFFIEHNKGHHVHVGTERDPATARKNEHFYKFYIRTLFGSYFHAWKLELERLKRKNKPRIFNKVIWYSIYPMAYCFAMLAMVFFISGTWNWSLILFFLGQSVVAFTLLELVNYVEHYGLKRKMIDEGRYEPVADFHSWNSSFTISNYFLFQLQLHSDHHMNAIKQYQALQHTENSPQLPAGYPTMIIMALVPPLWKKVVHPVLSKWEHSSIRTEVN